MWICVCSCMSALDPKTCLKVESNTMEIRRQPSQQTFSCISTQISKRQQKRLVKLSYLWTHLALVFSSWSIGCSKRWRAMKTRLHGLRNKEHILSSMTMTSMTRSTSNSSWSKRRSNPLIHEPTTGDMMMICVQRVVIESSWSILITIWSIDCLKKGVKERVPTQGVSKRFAGRESRERGFNFSRTELQNRNARKSSQWKTLTAQMKEKKTFFSSSYSESSFCFFCVFARILNILLHVMCNVMFVCLAVSLGCLSVFGFL